MEKVYRRFQSVFLIPFPIHTKKFYPTSLCPKIFSKINSSGPLKGPWVSEDGKTTLWVFLCAHRGYTTSGHLRAPHCVARFDISLVELSPSLATNTPGPINLVSNLLTLSESRIYHTRSPIQNVGGWARPLLKVRSSQECFWFKTDATLSSMLFMRLKNAMASSNSVGGS